MRPDIIKDKNKLIEEIQSLKRDNLYYRGKCDAYEYVIMKLKLFAKE